MVHILKYESSQKLEDDLAVLLRNIAHEAISNRGKMIIGVSGGSMIQQLTNVFPKIHANNPSDADWSKWVIFFCDERIVSFDDKESTFGAYKAALLQKIPELEPQFETIDPSKDAHGNERIYHNKLLKHFGNAIWPTFDLLLLGMGPDGHTCSLFPGHPLLQETRKWVAAITDSPKPPPSRITLTLPVINHARNVAFIACGASKRDPLRMVFKEDNKTKLPIGLVKPQTGVCIWMLDKEAAADLDETDFSGREDLKLFA